MSATLEDGCPSDAAFASSPSAFGCSASLPLADGVAFSLSTLAGSMLTLGESTYLLDNGDGLQRFRDVYHHLAFEAVAEDQAGSESAAEAAAAAASAADIAPPTLLVGAHGTTEFGQFISFGCVHSNDDGSLVLTLARRYIDSEDIRSSWESGAAVLKGCAGEGPRSDLAKSPWIALPWRVHADSSERRRSKPKTNK